MALIKRDITTNPDNALQLKGSDALCCGDTSPVTVHDYTLAADTGTVTTASSIRIAGVTYAFPATYSTTTADGRNSAVAAIASILKGLGYVNVRVTVTFSTPTATFKVWGSQVVITGLNGSGNAFTQGTAYTAGKFA